MRKGKEFFVGVEGQKSLEETMLPLLSMSLLLLLAPILLLASMLCCLRHCLSCCYDVVAYVSVNALEAAAGVHYFAAAPGLILDSEKKGSIEDFLR